MIKIRIIKDYKSYKIGDLIEATNNEAFGLIENGFGEKQEVLDNTTKDMYIPAKDKMMKIERKNKKGKVKVK